MGMEHMNRPLFEGQPEEPEKTEYEPGSPEEKVDSWMKEYVESHQSNEGVSYEIPSEVGIWFDEYKNREATLQRNDAALGRKEWGEERRTLTAEYEEQLKKPEYELCVLQKESEENEEAAGRNQYRIERLRTVLGEQAEEEWWEEHAEEIPPRNLRTHFGETATAMADIERGGWAENQDKESFSLLGALRYAENRNESPLTEYSYEIYGVGGGNRWFMNEKGEVRFSKHHAWSPSPEKLAQKVGRRGFVVS